jgi:hypothetical protein
MSTPSLDRSSPQPIWSGNESGPKRRPDVPREYIPEPSHGERVVRERWEGEGGALRK